MIENKPITGKYNISISQNSKTHNFTSTNMVTNEGVMLIAKSLMTNDLTSVDWKFRVGTGRKQTNITDTYESMKADTTDMQIVEFDVGSFFYKEESNILTMNGIVLSDQGFVKSMKLEKSELPEENKVSVGYKLSDIHNRMPTKMSSSYSNLLKIVGYDDKTIATIPNDIEAYNLFMKTAQKTGSSIMADLIAKNREPITISYIDLGGWINDVDDSKKWGNISLIAVVGNTRYLFSRAVLPPFLKSRGVRMVVSYQLIM